MDELIAAEILPNNPEPIRIDRFIEKKFGISAEYEDLGDGILGMTQFGSKGVARIIVARSLDEEGTEVAARQIRTTLAHEAGHGLLHGEPERTRDQSLRIVYRSRTRIQAPHTRACLDFVGETRGSSHDVGEPLGGGV
jgi:hypothetical protein